MLRSLVLLLLLCGRAYAADPVFEERAAALGISHSYVGGWEHFVGGGVAAFDCNGDLFADLYVAGGAAPAALLVNTTRSRGADLVFEEDTPKQLAMTGVIGAYPLNIDDDEYLDLFVLRVGPNVLLKGGPNCSFAAFDDKLGFTSAERWSTAFSATWEAGQVLPTLAVGNYVDREDPDGPFETCDVNLLYRPEGARYADPIALEPGYCALSMLFSDWGRNARADLRISNDRHYYVKGGQEQLWKMDQAPRLYGESEGWQRFTIWGMGIASRDITGDGLPEVMLSSMGDQKLQSLNPDAEGPAFKDATFDRGTTAHRPFTGDDGRPSTGWHVAFGDVQNDGRDDIFIAKGNVEQMPGSAMKDPNNLLLQQADGRFSEAADTAGLASFSRARGAALVDMNLDGLLDLAVVNRRANVEIYQNRTVAAGHWLQVRLEQAAPNRDAIGAWIEVETPLGRQSRELTVGGGHASGAMGFQHFGLGDAETVRLRVIWPGGTASDWLDVRADQLIEVAADGSGLRVAPR